jgi:uncharacterized protein (DUF885 family)
MLPERVVRAATARYIASPARALAYHVSELGMQSVGRGA